MSSSKAPKSHVKLVTHMQYDNGYELLITVFFSVSPQLGVLGTKSQDLVIPFRLGEEEPLPDFHIKALSIRSELVFMRD